MFFDVLGLERNFRAFYGILFVMKAIILAAGNGIRLRPLTYNTPKPLVKVAGQPLIHHLVSKLPEEVDEVIFVVGYLGNQIREYCGNEFLGRKVSYVEQENRRGTYHAVSLCQPQIHGDRHGKFFVFYGDDLIDANTIKELMKHERAVITQEVADPRRFGVLTLNDDGSIKELIEKPENPMSNKVLASGMLLDYKIFQYPPPNVVNGEYFLSTAVAEMAKYHKVMAVKAGFWVPIGAPEDIEKAEIALKKLGN